MITIFTPTYNRAHTLNRLYESLCKQTDFDFEWLIVDDGSVDSTVNFLKDIQEKANFPIRVFKQVNSGKHIAINKGVFEAKYNWFFIVDSDDILTPDSVSLIKSKLANISNEVVGVTFRKANFKNQVLGLDLSASPNFQIMTPTEAGHLFKGDLAYVFRLSVMKKNLFPHFSGEKFVPELYIWNKISDLGQIQFWGKDVIYLCEYLEDGYSFNFKKNLRNNSKGFSLFYFNQVSREKQLRFKLKNLIRFLQCKYYELIK